MWINKYNSLLRNSSFKAAYKCVYFSFLQPKPFCFVKVVEVFRQHNIANASVSLQKTASIIPSYFSNTWKSFVSLHSVISRLITFKKECFILAISLIICPPLQATYITGCFVFWKCNKNRHIVLQTIQLYFRK